MFTQIAKHKDLSRDAYPAVLTVDSFQSRESSIVIVDSTVTDNLGFVDSENKMNVACTRPKDALVLVGSPKTMARSLTGNENQPKTKRTADKFTRGRRRITDATGNL